MASLDEGPSKAYWNVNIAPEHHTATCPPFLLDLEESDKIQLGIKDSDYALMTWEEVESIVENNRLDQLRRIPSELRRYRQYIADVKTSHGSVMDLMIKERLNWSDLTPQGAAFENPDDLKILYNDWPYGIHPKIVHLVVWVKFNFEEDSSNGDLTAEARKMIERYVEEVFRSHVDPDHVLWWKNWSALKSVHAIEHFHVLLYDPDPAFVKDITSGDKPMSQRGKETS